MSNSYRFKFAAVFDDRQVFNGEPCDTKTAASQQLEIVANYTLYLHECKFMNDYSNAGWIEQFIDGEWVEIDEDDV
jgi:hypothetical protein